MQNQRAYSLLEFKAVNEDERIIRGIATTPDVDRVGDIVESLGIKFKNPLPLLWQPQNDAPVGTVKFDAHTKHGVKFEATLPRIAAEGTQRARIERTWQKQKAQPMT